MINKRTEPENLELSRELLRAISAETSVVEVDLIVLVGRDLADLKRILRGEIIPKVAIDKKRAVNVLARSERSVEAGEILASILSNTEELATIRVLAALNLSLMPPEVAERALLQNLASDDEIVRSEILRSLGRIGTADGLAYLKELPIQDNEYTQRQLSFAKLAISFRSASEDQDAQDVLNTLGIRRTTLAAKPVERKRVQEYINAIGGSTYGINLSPNIAFELSCGKIRHFLFLNDEIRRGAFINSIHSRAMIAGLVAMKEQGVMYLATRYLVLTLPVETGVDVIVTGTSGNVAYAGEARPDGDRLRIEMRDVGCDRAPMQIRGFLSNDDIHLNLRIWRGITRIKKHGEPIHS